MNNTEKTTSIRWHSMSKNLAIVGKKTSLLAGRNLDNRIPLLSLYRYKIYNLMKKKKGNKYVNKYCYVYTVWIIAQVVYRGKSLE